jgi:serine/threonine protein kinase
MSRPNWIGKTLGNRYQIQEILGQGGMSAVYKALDPNLQRVVAVKLIHPHLSEDPKFISRFEEEARSVAQLRHPNITQIYDFNHDGDVYYMVQEFVPGETLQERLRRLNRDGRPMALADAVRFTMDICSAMGYAHDRGLIHRDIKPANIMLDVQGKAILMDFGIVKIVGGSSHTTTGAVVGTAMYMAPDVIRGETPDARSDIYSLGVTLFEMVSGRPPFKADSAMSLMMMHLHDPLPDLYNLRPETPDDLIAVIEKSLAKGRADRYQSAQEMWAVLKRVLDRLEGGVSPVMAQVVQPPSRLAPNQAATQLEPQVPGSGQVVGAASAPPGPAKPPERTLRESELAQRAQQSQVGRPGAASDPGISGPTRMEVSPAPPLMASGAYPQEQQGAARPAGSGAVPPSSASPARPAAPAAAKPVLARPALLAGGGIVLVLILFCLVAGGLAGGYMLNRAGMFTGATDTPAATLTATQTSAVVAPLLQATTATSSPTSEAATAPALPTPTPTPEFIPTITIPAGIHFARINTIELDDQGRYIVSYETSEFTEQLPGEHVHFFFNTVPPEQAGVPGKGPWILYGGPRPFSQYKASDRPQNASQMCILVANPNHSVQPDSGNCLPLPDVPAVTMRSDSICRAGPGEAYGSVAPLSFRTTVLLRGLSMDEGWWFIQNPESFSDSCWIPISLAVVSGDISQLQVIEAPALPTDVPAASQSVEITGITVDSQNRYVVDFVTQNFTPQIPGVHIHFFFNTVSPDQVGLGGSGDRLMFGGPSPFTGYTVSDRPAGATQMCATVVNPDHSVIPNSGNCFDLPSTPLAGLPVP